MSPCILGELLVAVILLRAIPGLSNDIWRLPLRLEIGSYQELGHQTHENELDPQNKQEHGQKKQGISVRLHIVQEFVEQSPTGKKNSSRTGHETKAPEEIHRLGGIASQHLYRDEIQQDFVGSAEAILAGTAKT